MSTEQDLTTEQVLELQENQASHSHIQSDGLIVVYECQNEISTIENDQANQQLNEFKSLTVENTTIINSIELENYSTQMDVCPAVFPDEMPNSVENIMTSNSKHVRSKRRHVDKNQWKSHRNKQCREKGKPYSGRKSFGGKWVYDINKNGKVVKPHCNCKSSNKDTSIYKCRTLTDDKRLVIFEHFWSLTWKEKIFYVKYNAKLYEKARSRQKCEDSGVSRRANSVKYFLRLNSSDDGIRVCKTMFLNTLHLAENTILNWIKKEHSCNNSTNNFVALENDYNPVTIGRKSLFVQIKKNLQLFFNELPKLESHYCRASTTKLYLEPNWQTKKQLYNEYANNWCVKKNVAPVSLSSFTNTFEDINLSLFHPKKDECDICVGYKTKNISEADYQSHIINKELARAEKQKDKDGNTEHVDTMDLQSVLLCPKSNVSSLYYKTKLVVHNFTIYNLKSNDGYCFLWYECEGGLGANEFSSIICNFLLTNVIPNLKEHDRKIILYSDNCTYQNKNCILANALLNLSTKENVTIFQKYLEKGHTQMEADSMHSLIERKLKHTIIILSAD